MKAIGIVVLTIGMAVAAFAQPGGGNDPVQPSIIADTSAITAGKPFKVGVLYKIQPGWHIYWKNPGETGFATTVEWALPKDFKVSETQYPAPWFFESPGPLASFGYEGEVLLFATVEPPANLGELKEIDLAAKTRWLMCSDRCIPGNQTLSAKLPVGQGQATHVDAFKQAESHIPQKGAVEGLSTSIAKQGSNYLAKLQVILPQGKQLVTADKHPSDRKPYFFPERINGFVVGVPKIQTTGSQIDADFVLTPSTATTPAPASVPGVLVYQLSGETPKIAAIEVK